MIIFVVTCRDKVNFVAVQNFGIYHPCGISVIHIISDIEA